VNVLLNNDLRPVQTTLFLNKLDALLEKLRLQYEGGVYNTREEVIEEFLRAIGKFYTQLQEPFLQLRPVQKGTPPSINGHNTSFSEIDQDLRVVFKELNTLEDLILRNFNFMVAEKDNLNKLLKRVSSKVGDYVLYSEDPIGDAIYFKDSFNDTSKIDYGSSLLKEKQCEILQAEGIVTLPLIQQGGTSTLIKSSVTINNTSNGSNGNYQEIGAVPHNNTDDILDANPDTWFEYERVQRELSEDDEPLLLDLTFYFDKPEVINFIKVNPNNFGTQTPVFIRSIDTSADGEVWVSIKDDIPIAGFLQEDEDNIFTLAPAVSKFTGQGLYTFTPRQVKYVHILLEQSTPYLIKTTSGDQWRYAIGLRDIELYAQRYEAAGDIISQPFISATEIQKVSLLASENPAFVSELADIVHQVSPDDGASWYSIQPQDRVSIETPEIVNFNTIDEDAVKTATPVYSIRHRMLLNRDPKQFKEGSSTLRRTVKTGIDILNLPTTSPIQMSLTRPPVAGTVVLMNPLWGSRTRTTNVAANKRVIGVSTGQSGMRLTLPAVIGQMLHDGRLTRDELVIWVNNDPDWVRVGNWSYSTVPVDLDGDEFDRVYTIDLTEDKAVVQFGDGNQDPAGRKGMVPSGGSTISFTLTAEAVTPSASAPHTYELQFSSDGDKRNFRIYREEPAKRITAEKIVPGREIHRLKYKNITGTPTFTNDTTPVFNTGQKKVFLDGDQENTITGDWSLDTTNGIVYSYVAAPPNSSITITYDYVPVVELSESDWDFVIGADNLYNKIAIKKSGYGLIQDTTGITPGNNLRIINLGHTSVVPGSVIGIDTDLFDGAGAVPFEVAYINGRDEFPDPAGTEDSVAGYYSIDYRNGLMYFADQTEDPSPSAIDNLYCSYTQINAEYNIARIVDTSKYTVDTTSSIISIEEQETLNVWGQKDSAARNDSLLKAIYDYVQTTRESIEVLEPFFSPIVREYVLKVLPKGAA